MKKAIIHGRIEVCDILLRFGADPSIENRTGLCVISENSIAPELNALTSHAALPWTTLGFKFSHILRIQRLSHFTSSFINAKIWTAGSSPLYT
jgi:hypothetical protein